MVHCYEVGRWFCFFVVDECILLLMLDRFIARSKNRPAADYLSKTQALVRPAMPNSEVVHGAIEIVRKKI